MSSGPVVDPFTGTDWEECNGFIRALRFRALWEGRQRDQAWIADYAAPHFSQKALLWYSRLSKDVRQDWFKLEIALLERWAPSEFNDEADQIKPTSAAAPSISCANRFGLPPQGVLKVDLDDPDNNYYVELLAGDLFCRLTKVVGEAIRVRCNSLSSAALLERTDGSRHSWLAVHRDLQGSAPDSRAGSIEPFVLSFLDSETMGSSLLRNNNWQLMNCVVTTNGEVIPCWMISDTRRMTLFPFVDGTNLILIGNPNGDSTKYPNQKKAKLFIEGVY